MKPTIVPFVDFLNFYNASEDLARRALEFVGVVIDRSSAGLWPLEPAWKFDQDESLQTFNSCFHASIEGVEFVSLSALQSSPQRIVSIAADLIPVDVELCIEALGAEFESRIAGQMETDINEAMILSLDPDRTLKGPPVALLKNIPPAFLDGPALIIIMTFMSAAIAALGDVELLDHISPFIRLTQRCLVLGCTDASRKTLLILAA